MIRGMEISVTPQELWGIKRGWKLSLVPSDLVIDAYVVKPPGTSRRMGCREPPGEERPEVLGEGYPQSWKLCAPCPYLALCISPMRLSLSYSNQVTVIRLQQPVI